MWTKIQNGATLGKTGSEHGVILRDEEYSGGCRITLERCDNFYAITCGVYGAMVHTAFCGEEDHNRMYEAMKCDLQEFLDADTTEEEEDKFYHKFVATY